VTKSRPSQRPGGETQPTDNPNRNPNRRANGQYPFWCLHPSAGWAGDAARYRDRSRHQRLRKGKRSHLADRLPSRSPTAAMRRSGGERCSKASQIWALAPGTWCRRRRPHIATTIVLTAVRPPLCNGCGRTGSHAIGAPAQLAVGSNAIGRSSPWTRWQPKRRDQDARRDRCLRCSAPPCVAHRQIRAAPPRGEDSASNEGDERNAPNG
jgi:hypothetical protein